MYQRDMILYTRRRSVRCWRARRLLRHSGYDFVIVDVTHNGGVLAEISKSTKHAVAPPYVVVDQRPVGDLRVVRALIHSGTLERVVRGNL